MLATLAGADNGLRPLAARGLAGMTLAPMYIVSMARDSNIVSWLMLTYVMMLLLRKTISIS